MTEYGVDTDAWRPLPWSWAAERLARSRNLWVVTASTSGRPQALPVWGVWSDDGPGFGFSCAPGARKAANIAANPQVCVMPEDTVECVSVEGRARVIEPGDPVREAWVDRYMAKYAAIEPELTPEFIRGNVMVEVVPERAFAVIERTDELATRATRWHFD